MFSIGEINKQNNQTARDEENRKVANFEVQEDKSVYLRFEGRLRILDAGDAANAFLAKVKGFNPGQVRVELKSIFA